jgi:hypothetical protein
MVPYGISDSRSGTGGSVPVGVCGVCTGRPCDRVTFGAHTCRLRLTFRPDSKCFSPHTQQLQSRHGVSGAIFVLICIDSGHIITSCLENHIFYQCHWYRRRCVNSHPDHLLLRYGYRHHRRRHSAAPLDQYPLASCSASTRPCTRPRSIRSSPCAMSKILCLR